MDKPQNYKNNLEENSSELLASSLERSERVADIESDLKKPTSIHENDKSNMIGSDHASNKEESEKEWIDKLKYVLEGLI